MGREGVFHCGFPPDEHHPLRVGSPRLPLVQVGGSDCGTRSPRGSCLRDRRASLTETTLSFLFWSGALAAAEWSIGREDEVSPPWGWLVWGLCVALAVRTHPFSVFLVPLAAFRMVLTRAGRRQLTRAAPYLGLAFAVAVAFIPWALGAETGSRPSVGGPPEEFGAFLLWPWFNYRPLW